MVKDSNNIFIFDEKVIFHYSLKNEIDDQNIYFECKSGLNDIHKKDDVQIINFNNSKSKLKKKDCIKNVKNNKFINFINANSFLDAKNSKL